MEINYELPIQDRWALIVKTAYDMQAAYEFKNIHKHTSVTAEKVYKRLSYIPNLTKEEITECLDKYGGGQGYEYTDSTKTVVVSRSYKPMGVIEDYS